jgi:flagellar protein FlaI
MSTQLPQQRLTVPAEVNEDDFYTLDSGSETLVTHADLEEAVDNDEKPYLREVQRYWVNKPYAFVVIYRNVRDNELRYIVVEPRLSDLEHDIVNFFRDKLRTSLNYERVNIDSTPAERSRIVRDVTFGLMKRYNLLSGKWIDESPGLVNRFKRFAIDFLERQADRADFEDSVRDEAPTPRDPATGEVQTINETQVRRVLYYLVRDFIRFDQIDPIKQDVNIEDISCDGYNSTVFVYHSEYGQQIISNIGFGVDDLDNFVKTLAQSAGKGISRRQPSVDATLADGSRAQLTLGTETSDRGTNFTIRQFNEIPFTPVDLINWRTFNIDMMAYLWLSIEQNKSVIFAGGTASGKTTTLNAVSLFMPSTAKIVSIEDTRELEIPQANWIPRTTRESFQEDGSGSIDEFDLLEDALRQRPDYVIMGEVRGEEGQTLFQMLNTGHTTYTTFHANKPREVVRRFTTDPINVSPSMFDAVDIICQQESVDIGGQKVRRARELVEVNEYSASTEQFSMNNAFGWNRKTDAFRRQGKSNVLEEIKDENAWDDKDLQREWNHRRLVLAYLVEKNINTYAGVAATLQGYMSSKETILSLIADDELRKRTAALHKMKTINIDVDPEKEALIPRPRTPSGVGEEAREILSSTESLLVGYDSNEVDFAQTIDDMLTDEGGLSETDQEILRELADEGTVGELPSGFDESIVDSGSVSGTGMAGVEFDEELEDLFEEDEDQMDNEGDQLILTSENLEKLNDSQPESVTDDTPDTEADMDDLDDFFQGDPDEEATPAPSDDDEDGNDDGPDVAGSPDTPDEDTPDVLGAAPSTDEDTDDEDGEADDVEREPDAELDNPLDGEEDTVTVSVDSDEDGEDEDEDDSDVGESDDPGTDGADQTDSETEN